MLTPPPPAGSAKCVVTEILITLTRLFVLVLLCFVLFLEGFIDV
jgi:hypothetical protein